MAFSTGNPHLTVKEYESGTAGGISFVDVDYANNGTGALADVDAFVPVYDKEHIQVYGLEIIERGTTNADLDVGILTSIGGALDADGFIDGADVDGPIGTLVAAEGVYAKAGGYLNTSGTTRYLGGTNLTAANSEGKVRIFYKKTTLPTAN